MEKAKYPASPTGKEIRATAEERETVVGVCATAIRIYPSNLSENISGYLGPTHERLHCHFETRSMGLLHIRCLLQRQAQGST